MWKNRKARVAVNRPQYRWARPKPRPFQVFCSNGLRRPVRYGSPRRESIASQTAVIKNDVANIVIEAISIFSDEKISSRVSMVRVLPMMGGV